MILSVDVGSSSVRALAFDAAGRAMPGVPARRSHRYRAENGGRVEADAEQLFGLVVECVDQAVAAAAGTTGGPGGDRRFEAVTFCTFWHGLIGVAADGSVLTPLLTWADTRSSPQASRLATELDAECVRQRTGCALHPSYFPAKLAWWRDADPAVFEKVDWWCTIGELCFLRFFGARRCSYSMASGSGLLDRGTLRWDPELLEALHVPASRFSDPCDFNEPSRGLRAPFAGRWPSLREVPWFPALGDGACSNVGCGAGARPVLMIGTTGALRMVRDRAPVPVPRGLWGYLMDRTRMLLGGVLGDGGNLAEWISGTLALGMRGEDVDAALLAAKPAGHGLTVLPFLTGERSTGWNPLARGAVMGLHPNTSSLDILQAGLEAVAYRFAAVRERLQEAAPGEGPLVATGGALLASPAWCQIVADALGLPVALSAVEEASGRGAALLALAAMERPGAAALQTDAPISRTFIPRPGAAEAHRAARAEQERLHRAVHG